jgi:hypothetical protein
MAFREDSLEFQVKEMTRRFIDELGLSKKNTKDITDKIWEDKETFGEIAFNLICEYLGDEVFIETFNEEAPDMTEDEEWEEKEENEDEE